MSTLEIMLIIGNHTTLRPGVKIYHDCLIGDNCNIEANCVIGADGFGFSPMTLVYIKKYHKLEM